MSDNDISGWKDNTEKVGSEFSNKDIYIYGNTPVFARISRLKDGDWYWRLNTSTGRAETMEAAKAAADAELLKYLKKIRENLDNIISGMEAGK